MLIDWFTVGAQALNFLVLMWLLKRFLYHPILAAIDAREQLIATQLADAEAKKAEARKERDEFLNKNVTFDKERATLLQQATSAANTERQRLLNDARQAATALSAKSLENLHNEARRLHDELGRRTQQEVFAIARKTLKDLAGTTLEARMVETFVNRLKALSPEEKQGLVAALKASAEPVIVRSAFELPEAQRTTTQAAIDTLLAVTTVVHFETAPDLVSGIELSAAGQKVAWSIAEYLTSMEKGISELLDTTAQAQAHAKTEATSPLLSEGQAI
jgi:F-type H+-transporting ATPase subunit b